jgi:hypothetical protein
MDRVYESLAEKEFEDWVLSEKEKARVSERAGILTSVTDVIQQGKGRKGLAKLASRMKGTAFVTALGSNFADGFGNMNDMPSGPSKKGGSTVVSSGSSVSNVSSASVSSSSDLSQSS